MSKFKELPDALLGRTWKTPDGNFTDAFLAMVVTSIDDGAAAWRIALRLNEELTKRDSNFRIAGGGDRRLDRALQLLKKHGVIRFEKDQKPGKWVLL